ncbi:NHL repeat-containing protein [Anaeromyxobacter oryzae]|uniref:NHL repeat protein n=1 Tax=Anaeromyxobacter oryzae TaxID=2918170 RepID=A0ABM7X4V8_9BACT|nr:hypothetical protein [Anaeromyxobacter oryzae]BDG06844.1 hypothetical protein AMOR_58400 [Anaeromyxobacter oryzae]
MRSRWSLVSVSALLVGAGCAHVAPGRPPPEVAWPAPPAEARVRLVAVFPDPGAPAPARSAWQTILDAVTGRDPVREAHAWVVRPFGVAGLPGGGWAIADPDGAAVLRLPPGSEPARVGCRGREWQAPMAVAAAPDGALWVADGGAAAVVRVAPDGSCRATAAGTFERPTGIAVAGGRVFVADPPRHQIVALEASGEVAARFGGHGEGDGELNFPTAVAVDRDGNLLVVDALNFRIARFSPDGRWLGAFGEAGDAGGALARPKGVAVDGTGRIYVTDAQRDLVLVYSAAGAFEAALGAPGSEPGYLTMPAGVATAGSRLCVADSQNRRVLVFEILGGRS